MEESDFIVLTDERVALLNYHKERTGVGPRRLLAGKRHEQPEGLNSGLIAQWIPIKRVKSVKEVHYDYVLKLWEGLPDHDSLFVELDEDIIENLRYHKDRTEMSAHKLLKGRRDIPKGLTACRWRPGITGMRR